MTIIGDKLYTGAGGFWSETKLLEYVKGKTEVNRELKLKGLYISGICKLNDHTIIVGTCGRKGSGRNILTFVDVDKMEIVKEKNIDSDISDGFMPTSGIALCDNFIYHAGGETSVGRTSIKLWRPEPNFIRANWLVYDDLDEGTADSKTLFLCSNVSVDKEKKLLYAAVAEERYEDRESANFLLVYDISKDAPKLVQRVTNGVDLPNGVFPLSMFY